MSPSGWCSATCATGAACLLDCFTCLTSDVQAWTPIAATEPFRVVLSHMRDRWGLHHPVLLYVLA
jgi:hypothetical protein